MINKIIKDYCIKSELGQGGMATVYLSENQLLGNKIAFKLLNKEFIHHENIRKRFLAEARSMARMSHPNIIKVTDLIDDGSTVAFVMEYVEGETLKEYIERKGKLSDDEIKSIFSQMLDAVGYVHEQNLVHRDIKPSNFMVSPSGIVKLMDFGIAKNTDVNSAEYTQTGTGVQMGTPMYMSPEQITETKSVTPRSDIYSLGVVLWQMATGEKPYDMKTLSTFHLQNKIVNEALPETNTRFDQIIKTATNKEIDKRFQNTSKFKDALLNEKKNVETLFNEEKTIIESAEKSEKVEQTIEQETTSPKVDEPKIVNVDKNKKSSIVDKMAKFLLIVSVISYLDFKNINNSIQLVFAISIILSSIVVSFFLRKSWFFYFLIAFMVLSEFYSMYVDFDTMNMLINNSIQLYLYYITIILSLILINLKVKKYAIIAKVAEIILIYFFTQKLLTFIDFTLFRLNIFVIIVLTGLLFIANLYFTLKNKLKYTIILNISVLILTTIITYILPMFSGALNDDFSLQILTACFNEFILFFTLLHFSKKLHAEDSVNK